MNIWAVVPAGGVGARMNLSTPKQYALLHDVPVICHTLNRLARVKAVNQIVLGLQSDDLYWRAINYSNNKLLTLVDAGEQREQTVLKCLQTIIEQGGKEDWALVHDSARPCVRVADIERLIEQVQSTGRGAILALPLSDTIKRGRENQGETMIKETIPREKLWRAMTPQLFKVGALSEAIKQGLSNKLALTDEASAMEAVGESPTLVPCCTDNIKITFPQDLALAERILEAQNKHDKY